MARIVVATSAGEVTHELEPQQVVTVGRDPGNRIPLEGASGVSRRHCRIGPREGGEPGWEVVDLGSTNKTRVNGAVVAQRVLAHGDEIEIGSARLRFEDPAEAERLEKMGREGVCYLEWVAGPRKGERVHLSDKRTTIGRRPTNKIHIDDRMVSGHHAEVDRDLNGYTIRDLGSTNGTLVNGEPVSEALLTHGARVRIGNARFAFKDPSMKDVEVELAHFEEDEGWGMMGEIDLSRAPGSKAGLLVVVLLFLAAGAGGWFLSQQSAGTEGGAVLAASSVENGTFDDEDVPWTADREEGVSVRVSPRGGQPGGWLSVRNDAEEGVARVTYDEDFDTVTGRPLDLGGFVKGGAGAAYVVVWASDPTEAEVDAGITAIQRSDVVVAPSGGWKPIEKTLVPPTWARVARIGLVLPPGADAGLDSLTVEQADEAAVRKSLGVRTYKSAEVDPAVGMELLANRTVLLTRVRPVARTEGDLVLTQFTPDGPVKGDAGTAEVSGVLRGSGEEEVEVPTRITWTTNEDGLRVRIEADGTTAVGLETSVPTATLGSTFTVLGDFLPQRVPAEVGQSVASVSRTLLGEPGAAATPGANMLAIVQDEEKAVATLAFAPSLDAGLVVLRHWVDGAAATMDVITDFTRQKREAEEALRVARTLAATAPGAAIQRLREVAQLYSFEERIRDDANRTAEELERKARDAVEQLAAALDDYRIFGSEASLARAETRASEVTAQYLAGGREGALEGEMKTLAGEIAAERKAFDLARAEPGVERLERLANLLENVEGYKPMAALYARSMLRRYEHLQAESPDLARRLEAARARLEKLLKNEDVQDALPPLPTEP